MDPKLIAEWIDEDIGPGRKGTIAEDLFGYRVNPGEHPIDRLLAAIDRAYLDFDLSNPKVLAIAKTLYGDRVPTDPRQWRQEILASSQSDDLKQKLVGMLGSAAPVKQPAGGGGKVRITLKSGKVIVADAVEPVVGRGGKEMYYVGFGPTSNGKLTSQWNQVKAQAPTFFDKVPFLRTSTGGRSGRMRWKFEQIITVNKENVTNIST